MKVLKETDKVKVWIDGDVKYFRSSELNYDHNMINGFCKTWGKTEEDDPEYSPYGPLIIDSEVSTICAGITKNGKKETCEYCYKCNSENGQNMSFETFKQIIENMDYNRQVQSVAFGLGATAEENPDLWKMCEWLRERYIIPNGTIAELDDATAIKIAMNFGGCAVSEHGNFEVLANTIDKLSIAKTLCDSTLKQINIHQVVYEENYEQIMELLSLVKTDNRFRDLNAIVFLGLKKCGKAVNGFNTISNGHLENIIATAIKKQIGIGFDSCSSNKISKIFKDKTIQFVERVVKDYSEKKMKKDTSEVLIRTAENNLEKVIQMCTPCESGIESSYVSVKGEYHNCSFQEHTPGCNLLTDNFQDYWENSDNIKNWRKMLRESNRSCPLYVV